MCIQTFIIPFSHNLQNASSDVNGWFNMTNRIRCSVITRVYLEQIQTSVTELFFLKINDSYKSITIFTKSFIIFDWVLNRPL